jgi:hypothetical protein
VFWRLFFFYHTAYAISFKGEERPGTGEPPPPPFPRPYVRNASFARYVIDQTRGFQ